MVLLSWARLTLLVAYAALFGAFALYGSGPSTRHTGSVRIRRHDSCTGLPQPSARRRRRWRRLTSSMPNSLVACEHCRWRRWCASGIPPTSMHAIRFRRWLPGMLVRRFALSSRARRRTRPRCRAESPVSREPADRRDGDRRVVDLRRSTSRAQQNGAWDLLLRDFDVVEHAPPFLVLRKQEGRALACDVEMRRGRLGEFSKYRHRPMARS